MENNTFSFNRFCKYFKYDLKQNWDLYGLSGLIIMALPLFVFIIFTIFKTLFEGPGIPEGVSIQTTAALVGMLTISLTYAKKVYGGLTDKKTGTEWILIPASKLEKYASMMLISLVILPVVLIGGFLAVDTLVALCAGYPPIINGKTIEFFTLLNQELQNLNICWPLILWGNWIQGALIMILGCICFKKWKVGKTILCTMGVTMVLSWFTPLLQHIDPRPLFEESQVWPHIILTLIYVVIDGALAYAVWYRIKTIKQ